MDKTRNRIHISLPTNEWNRIAVLKVAALQAYELLDRVDIEDDTPFDPELFTSDVVEPFSSLSQARQNYLRLKLTHSDDPELRTIDLGTARIRFGTTLWFQSFYIGEGNIRQNNYQLY